MKNGLKVEEGSSLGSFNRTHIVASGNTGGLLLNVEPSLDDGKLIPSVDPSRTPLKPSASDKLRTIRGRLQPEGQADCLGSCNLT